MVLETLTLGNLDVISEIKKELKRIKLELIKVEIQTYLLDKRTEEAERLNRKLVKDVEKWKKKYFILKHTLHKRRCCTLRKTYSFLSL